MKRLITPLILLFVVGTAYAQEPDTTSTEPSENKKPRIIYYQTTPEPEKQPIVKHRYRDRNRNEIKTLAGSARHSGGFGALSFRATEFRDQTMVLAGARAGWIINRTLGIGFEAHGIVPTTRFDDVSPIPDQEAIALGGYGGMFLELIFFSNEVVHVTFPVSGGAGWIGYVEDWQSESQISPRQPQSDLIDEDIFWYVEPGANLELNVSRNVRLAFGVSKRFTQDLALFNTRAQAFDELNYYLTLKFGRF
jgi:hypothetical protein